MDVGFIGLGKLGLPTALAVESRGHRVVGHDVDPNVARILQDRATPYREAGAAELLAHTAIALRPTVEVVDSSEIVFVTIQTPHDTRFEGISRLPDDRRDFDYSFLESGAREIATALDSTAKRPLVVIVSTVLPGTLRRRILPAFAGRAPVVYNPFFIAMGTAIADFLAPEFVLLGGDDPDALDRVGEFYATIHDRPNFRTSVENAEIVKVVYNTFISTKIAFANTVMELCDRMPGSSVDVVTRALALGSDRIVSPRYLGGGMGDGGACHPRDNIALSWLARELGMSFDWFDCVMRQRERQTEWLASLVAEHSGGRRVVLLGKAFKADSNIVAGSPAMLLLELLRERGLDPLAWDPHVDVGAPPRGEPFCYFVATKHAEFRDFAFEPGSVVLDPFRYVAPRDGVEIVPIGAREGIPA